MQSPESQDSCQRRDMKADLSHVRAPVRGLWPLGLEYASFPGEILDPGQRLTECVNQILAGGPLYASGLAEDLSPTGLFGVLFWELLVIHFDMTITEVHSHSYSNIRRQLCT